VATPGPAGLTEIETAAAAATNLPEPERVSIDAALLARRGESVAAITKLQRLTEIAPGYSRGHALLGSFLLNQDKLDEGIAALKKATQADPNNGAAQNTLGYAALRRGDTDGAIAAFREYGRVMPKEPNAQDSLGEALLAAGRFKEAEEAFEKALTLSPQFWSAHQGIAMARYYAGDLNGARDAWAKAKATATRTGDKMSVDADLGAASLAQGNADETVKILAASAQTDYTPPPPVDNGGIQGFEVLDQAGIAGVAVAARSARIGDGRSTLQDGIVSHVNRAARSLGARVGSPALALARAVAEKSG